MKLLVICLVALGSVSCHSHREETYENADIKDPSLRKAFKNFVVKYRGQGKLRSNGDVRNRFRVFAHNAHKIKAHNKKHTGWRMDINEFADKTVKERLSYTGLANVTAALKAAKRARRSVLHLRKSAPEAYDHRDEGHVTKVTNQGECGSCWTYGTVYPLEGALAIASGKDAEELSQQEILSCTYEHEESRNGCNGGWYMDGWDYAKKSGHLTFVSEDPYLGIDLTCDPDIMEKRNALQHYKVTGYERVPQANDDALKVASSKNVVAIALESIGLFFYSDGLFYDDGCATPADVDHAVTLVGYSPKAWIVKNSWGEDWGEKGYVRMSRKLKNHCGISDYAFYPVVEKKSELELE